MIVHGADGAVCAGGLHTGSAALLASVALCCRSRSAAIGTVRTVEGSMAGLSGAGYRDLRGAAFRRAPPIYVWPMAADSDRVEAGVRRGLKEGD
jgi:hypothetical protein